VKPEKHFPKSQNWLAPNFFFVNDEQSILVNIVYTEFSLKSLKLEKINFFLYLHTTTISKISIIQCFFTMKSVPQNKIFKRDHVHV